MSLKAIAEEALARLKSGETGHETKKETEVKHMKQGQVEQPVSCFTEGSVCFMPMKHHSRRKTAENGACFTVSFPRGGTDETSLAEHVIAGLARLPSMPTPRRVRPAAWAEVVADAVRLEREGWAATALALGWTELDLFGAITDADGDPNGDGLAVKLDGRQVLAICESFATVADENGGRSYLYRSDEGGSQLLWEIGR